MPPSTRAVRRPSRWSRSPAASGVHRGSFYWHFSGRRELLETAIKAWEAHSTEAIIAESERGDDVAAQLVDLGQSEAEAQRRAALAITLTVGIDQLAIGAPGPMSRRSLSEEAFAATLYGALTM